MREAGFDVVEFVARVSNVMGLESTRAAAEGYIAWIENIPLFQESIELGLTTNAELKSMVDGIRQWGEHPDAYLSSRQSPRDRGEERSVVVVVGVEFESPGDYREPRNRDPCSRCMTGRSSRSKSLRMDRSPGHNRLRRTRAVPRRYIADRRCRCRRERHRLVSGSDCCSGSFRTAVLAAGAAATVSV